MIRSSTQNAHLLTVDSDFKCQVEHHTSEKIEFICTHISCTASSRLACETCKYKLHDTHVNALVKLKDFSQSCAAYSQIVLQELGSIQEKGGQAQLCQQRVIKGVGKKIDELRKQFSGYLKSQKQRLTDYFLQKQNLMKAEQYSLLSEIDEFKASLKKTLEKSWKNVRPEEVTTLLRIFRKDDLDEHFQMFDPEKSQSLKIIREKMEQFFAASTEKIAQIIQEIDKELSELNSESSQEEGQQPGSQAQQPSHPLLPLKNFVLKRKIPDPHARLATEGPADQAGNVCQYPYNLSQDYIRKAPPLDKGKRERGISQQVSNLQSANKRASQQPGQSPEQDTNQTSISISADKAKGRTNRSEERFSNKVIKLQKIERPAGKAGSGKSGNSASQQSLSKNLIKISKIHNKGPITKKKYDIINVSDQKELLGNNQFTFGQSNNIYKIAAEPPNELFSQFQQQVQAVTSAGRVAAQPLTQGPTAQSQQKKTELADDLLLHNIESQQPPS